MSATSISALDRSRRLPVRLFITAALGAVSIALGLWGFERAGDAPFNDDLYGTLQLFALEYNPTLHDGWQLAVARYLAPATTLIAAVFALLEIFEERLNRFVLGRRAGHVVIIGFGPLGETLTRAYLARGRNVVVAEWPDTVVNRSVADGSRRLLTVTGDVTDRRVLERARVRTAGLVIAVCRNDVESVPAGVTAAKLAAGHATGWCGRVHVADPAAYELLVEHHLAAAPDAAGEPSVGYFNVIESATRALLSEHPPFRGSGLEDVARPHIAVVGMGRMGSSVVRQAARVWRVVRPGDEPLRVTVVDRDARRVVDEFTDAHELEACACEFTTRTSYVGDPSWLDDVTRVYVCLESDEEGLAVAARIHYRAAVPVVLVARTLRERPAADLLEQLGRGTAHDHLRIFPVADRAWTPELVEEGDNEILARAIHAAYLDEMARQGVTRPTERHPSVTPWDDLDATARAASRGQAQHIDVKLAAVGCRRLPIAPRHAIVRDFEPAEIEALAALEHERWLNERTAAGYRYGADRIDDGSVGHLTHPDLLPWDRLDETSRDLDRRAVARIPEFLARVGFDVVRLP